MNSYLLEISKTGLHYAKMIMKESQTETDEISKQIHTNMGADHTQQSLERLIKHVLNQNNIHYPYTFSQYRTPTFNPPHSNGI